MSLVICRELRVPGDNHVLCTQILIIDDEPRMCDSLKALSSGRGYEIHTDSSGKKDIGDLAENSFDLLLLDIVLPDMDGCQVMHYIYNHDLESVVIFITGEAIVESAIDALRNGAYDYLRKPFEHEQLLKTVGNAIEQKRLKSERKHVEEALPESEVVGSKNKGGRSWEKCM